MHKCNERKCRIASTEKWKDPEYRNNVLSSVIGLKRSEEFKIAQSERAKNQMKDIEQRKLRSKIMKESWENGNIVYTTHVFTNSSKQEKIFFEELNKFINVKQKHVIRYIHEITKRKRHLFPDGFIEDLNLIIEFHGSFWYTDIRLFPNDNDIVHHNISAGDVRKCNEEKKQLYKKLGYNYIEIWSKDFLDDPNNMIKNILEKIELFK